MVDGREWIGLAPEAAKLFLGLACEIIEIFPKGTSYSTTLWPVRGWQFGRRQRRALRARPASGMATKRHEKTQEGNDASEFQREVFRVFL